MNPQQSHSFLSNATGYPSPEEQMCSTFAIPGQLSFTTSEDSSIHDHGPHMMLPIAGNSTFCQAYPGTEGQPTSPSASADPATHSYTTFNLFAETHQFPLDGDYTGNDGPLFQAYSGPNGQPTTPANTVHPHTFDPFPDIQQSPLDGGSTFRNAVNDPFYKAYRSGTAGQPADPVHPYPSNAFTETQADHYPMPLRVNTLQNTSDSWEHAVYGYPSPISSTFQSPAFNIRESGIGSQTPTGHGHEETQIPPGTMHRKQPRSPKNEMDWNRSQDKRFTEVVKVVTRIMADVPVSKEGCCDPILYNQKVTELQQYLADASGSDPEIFQWIQDIQFDVGAQAGKQVAYQKRKLHDGKDIFICLWCNNTLTVKNNLGNHIRSHLRFPISFCEECDFSSVTPCLPGRHTQTVHKKGAVAAPANTLPSVPAHPAVNIQVPTAGPSYHKPYIGI